MEIIQIVIFLNKLNYKIKLLRLGVDPNFHDVYLKKDNYLLGEKIIMDS